MGATSAAQLAGSAKTATGILSGAEALAGFVNQDRAAGALTTQASFEAKLADLQATDAIRRGSEAARRMSLETSAVVGRARAAGAASGIDIASGSARDVQVQDRTIGELDAQAIRNNAAREALGYTTQAGLNTLAARAKAASLRTAAVETLVTGAARTYGFLKKSRLPSTPTSLGSGDGEDPSL